MIEVLSGLNEANRERLLLCIDDFEEEREGEDEEEEEEKDSHSLQQIEAVFRIPLAQLISVQQQQQGQ